MSKNMNLIFVLPSNCKDETETSTDMQEAFEAYRQNHLNPEWIREVDILNEDLSKNEIVCFDKFEGEVFEELSKRKCLRVVGPRCLSICLMHNMSVPSNGRPVFNVAMVNMKISITNIHPEKKAILQKKIEYMGGVFCQQITSFCTHLISKGTKSKKYSMAVKNNIPVMLETWVDAVWNDNMKEYKTASHSDYMTKFKCPTFHELHVSSTGFDEAERHEIKNLIEENGGIFSARMNIHRTNILLCKSSSANSEKFNSALKNHIPCVSKTWLLESINAGVALIEEPFLIKVSSSTPTKNSRPPDFDMSTMSVISTISGASSRNRVADKTTLDCSNYSLYKTSLGSANKTQKPENNQKDLEQKILDFDLKSLKGQDYFLDGCSIYLVGFNSNVREKLCRILKLAGATRYDDMSDRVTQVLVGDENCHELKLLAKKGCTAPFVSVEWLMESIRLKGPDWEPKHLVRVGGSPAAPASPSVSKGLNLLRANTSTKEANAVTRCLKFGNDDVTEDPKTDDLMQHYLAKAKADEDDTLARYIANEQFNTKNESEMVKNNPQQTKKELGMSTIPGMSNIDSHIEDIDNTNPLIFKDKKFLLVGFNEESLNKFKSMIAARGGVIKNQNYSGIPDYAVVPTFVTDLNISALEIVNQYYINDCDSSDQILSKRYYHEPIVTNGTSKPLDGLVITSSNYVNTERIFIKELIEYLGAQCQKVLAKMATTHLICKTPTGKKFEGATAWGIKCVSHRWLIACLENDQRVDEKLYPVIDEENSIVVRTPVNKKLESVKTSKYFPSPPNHAMSKLDISVVRKGEETPKSINGESVLLGFDKSSVEKSSKFVEELNAEKNKSITNFEFNTPPTKNPRISDELKNKKEETAKFGTPSILQGGDVKDVEAKEDFHQLELDGEKLNLTAYMQKLKDKGLFEVGSPASKYDVSPYVVPKGKPTLPRTPDLHSTMGEGASQDTPVGKYIRGLQQRNVLPGSSGTKCDTPDSPMPRAPFDIKTPDTPLGAFHCEDGQDPSPNTRKYWQRRIDRLPGTIHEKKTPVEKNRRVSTPFKELQRQTWEWINRSDSKKDESFGTFRKRRKTSTSQYQNITEPDPNDGAEPTDEADPNTTNECTEKPQVAENPEVASNLKKLQEMLSSNENGKNSVTRRSSVYKTETPTPQKSRFSHLQCNLFPDGRDSQQDNIGWADPVESEDLLANDAVTEQKKVYRKFMLSGITAEEKTACEKIITYLGGEVSTCPSFDPTATHLVCQTANRNEKILASIASGKFIIHFQYVYDSEKKGEFVPEKFYEFGNPSCDTSNMKISLKSGSNVESYYWWRKHIEQTGKKAFNGMRIILIANNKDALVRLIEAGDGVVVNVARPFTHHVDATHCLIDFKVEHDLSDFVPLAKQGIPCLNVVFLSHYLNSMGDIDPMQHIPIELKQYYH